MQYALSLIHHPLAASYAYFFAAVWGAIFAINARRPFARDGHLSIWVFFAGWLTTELPLHHLAFQVAATAAFVWAGALHGWPGFVGLGIAVVSWIGLFGMYRKADEAAAVVERALTDALGEGYADRIDPEVRRLLDTPQSWRQLLLPFSVRRPEVKRIRDIAYGPHGRRNLLDIYKPRAPKTGCPVLVQVHGGAWVLGQKEHQALPLMTYLASLGWVCVAINYRLSPRATFPDHLVDVKRALAWVKAHIAEHGGDPSFVIITGGSAGGHLSSLAALTADDPSYQPGFEDADTSVAACVPFYGVYDFTNREGLGRKDMLAFLGRHVFKKKIEDAREAFDRASPMSRVTPAAPPFLVVHGTHDTLAMVEEARLFVSLLRATSRSPVAYAEIPGAQHAFEVFASARTAHVIRGVARFVSYLHGTRAARLPAPAIKPAAVPQAVRAIV